MGGAFVFLLLLLLMLSQYFNAEIQDKSEELSQKREIVTTLAQLKSRWSKKAQGEELAKIYKLLNVFDIVYSVKEKRKKKIITMQLKEKNADKILALLVNRSINIKKITIEKKDSFTLELIMEVL